MIPFAQITFDVQTEDILDLEIQLVRGARNDPNPAPPPNGPQHEQQEHTEHPHKKTENIKISPMVVDLDNIPTILLQMHPRR